MSLQYTIGNDYRHKANTWYKHKYSATNTEAGLDVFLIYLILESEYFDHKDLFVHMEEKIWDWKIEESLQDICTVTLGEAWQ